MIYPSGEKLHEKVGSRYALVVLAAKRAKQLREGAPKLIETDSTNPLTVALEEIAAGKVRYRILDEEELRLREAEQRELLASFEEEPIIPEDMELVEDDKPSIHDLLKIEDEDEEAETEVLADDAEAVEDAEEDKEEEDSEEEPEALDALPLSDEPLADEEVEPAETDQSEE